MNGHNAAVGVFLEQTARPYKETARRDIPQSELVQDIASDLPSTEKYRTGSITGTATVVTAQEASQSSQDFIDLGDLFPPEIRAWKEARYKFSVLQEWEGYVVSIAQDTFTARLVDVTKGTVGEEEEAEFPLNDLQDIDRPRIRDGAIFRWIIGYHRAPGGTKDRSSRIVFRNLPAWTTRELERNQREATEWAMALREE